MKINIFLKKEKVKDLATIKRDALKEIAREQFETLKKMDILFPVISVKS